MPSARDMLPPTMVEPGDPVIGTVCPFCSEEIALGDAYYEGGEGLSKTFVHSACFWQEHERRQQENPETREQP